MRERPKDKNRLEHILHSLGVIDFLKKGKSYHECENDIAIYYALIKNLEIIGEAVYKLTKEFKQKHPATPWSEIEKLRHVIVHDYYRVDFNIVWDTIENDLSEFIIQIEKYLLEEKNLHLNSENTK